MAEPGRPRGRMQGHAETWPPRSAAAAGGLSPSRIQAWSSFAAKLREWTAAEAGAGRLFPWVPVAFGTGIAIYFAADHEPILPVVLLAAAALAAVAWLSRRRKLFPAAVMVGAIAAGFAAATWRTAWIGHVVLARPIYAVQLSGFVETRDIRERTDRFVLRVTRMESPRAHPQLRGFACRCAKALRPMSAALSN